jgi:hypothetical protein
MAKKQQEPDYTDASTWQQRFENRKIKQRQMFEDASKYYDIMYAVQNVNKISAWKSKVYVPVLASKAWDLIARMSDVVPLFQVMIKNELTLDDDGNFAQEQGVAEREDRIEAKLQYDYENGHTVPMKLKVFDALVDSVVAGTGYAYAPWCFEQKKSYAREFDEQGNMNNEEDIVKTAQTGYNDFIPINFFNVFVADGPSFFEAPYLIVRGYKPKVDMEKEGIYENLDACDTGPRQPVDEFTLYDMSRDRVLNELNMVAMDDTVDMITYYECYERTVDGIVLTTYAEGLSSATDDEGNPNETTAREVENHPWVEIRKSSIPYWHNMFPLVPFYTRRKSFSPFGESLFENNRTLQSATNDLFNHYLDNWNLAIESMLIYEDGTLTNDFIVEPGGEITYTGDPPKQFKFPEPNPTQLSLVMKVLQDGIENATFSQYASGQPSSSLDKTQGTAYGVRTITEAATTKIGFMRDNFKQSMKILGKIWLSNLQQFSDDPAEIRRKQNGKVIPDVVLPSDYQGEMDLDIDDDSMTPLSKQDKMDANDRFLQTALLIQKAAIQQASIFKQTSDIPRYNFNEFFEDAAELFSKRDLNSLVLDNTVQVPEAAKDPKELITFNYKDGTPFIQSQIEEAFGFQPDPEHSVEATTSAMQHGQTQGQIMNPQGGTNGPTQQPDGNGTGNQPTGVAA